MGMTSAEVLLDGFERVRGVVQRVVSGLGAEQLELRLDDGANTIAWLVWHLTRIQDDHVADVAGTGQVWAVDGWAERFGLPFEASATGFGQAPQDAAAVRVSTAGLLTGYHDAVHERTVAFVRGLTDDDLDRIVDTRWDPPVTLGARLVSVISDDLQHAGQAAFVRGIAERRSAP
jgi:uncharacterized damage-inducible protein DinB